MVARNLTAALVLLMVSSLAHSAKRELTPADALATVRIMGNQLLAGQPVGDLSSPDGKRYVIRTAYGDVKRNGIWVDLFTGSQASLEAAAHPKRCAHLITTGLGSVTSVLAAEADADSANLIRWFDPTHIGFLWSDAHAVRQVMTVDLVTCKHQFLTHTPGDVFTFASTPQGRLLYNAQVPRDSAIATQLWAQGFMVSDSSDGFSIMQGYIEDASAVQTKFQSAWYVLDKGTTKPVSINGQPVDHTHPYFRDLSIAPSGRYAVTSVGVTERPSGWERYPDRFLQQGLTTDKPRLPVRYTVIDLKSGTAHLLWNAPLSLRGQVHWSPTEDSLLLAPTYLPLDTNSPTGLTGNAAAVIDARTGDYRLLPLDLTDRTIIKLQWSLPTQIELATTDTTGNNPRTEHFVRHGDTWQLAATSDSAKPEEPLQRPAPIRLETRQSLNTPPQVFAVDTRTNSSRVILDPNPGLIDTFQLGHIERLTGITSNGKQWIAQLIYPADYQLGTRYPLVIQSSYGPGFGAEEFTLQGDWGADGMGLGPTTIPSYLGQLLATRNIAVVDMEVLHFDQGVHEAEDYRLAYEAVSRQLIDAGLADPSKIALDGFSENGYWVDYTLAHSAFPFAAAIAVDNFEPSYLQSALGNWTDMTATMNGAPAFGDGLNEWIKNAAGFNAEHIHSPLLMLEQSYGLAMITCQWEIYSRLRHLNKPVQMYVMPRADLHGSHLPQNPQQLLAVQGMALDWLQFWLTGYEDPAPTKRQQYVRWHRLAGAVSTPASAPGTASSSSAIANP
jgi:hypothetical protein